MDDYHPSYSLIVRKIEFERGPDIKEVGEFNYQSDTVTSMLQFGVQLENDISILAYLSIELADRSYDSPTDISGSESFTYLKGGASLNLTF